MFTEPLMAKLCYVYIKRIVQYAVNWKRFKRLLILFDTIVALSCFYIDVVLRSFFSVSNYLFDHRNLQIPSLRVETNESAGWRTKDIYI